MSLGPEDLAFRARALAQGHPLTPLAKAFIDRTVEEQRKTQRLPEIGTWADAALITGYCLRRVEEDVAGLTLTAREAVELSFEDLDEAALSIAADLRSGERSHVLGDDDGDAEERTVAALDRIIASEVDKRIHNWKESMDHAARAEVEDYITWWTVKGYAVRAAEMAAGALK